MQMVMRRRQRRHRDLVRAVEDRDRERLAGQAVAVDVLDLDGRVVDQHADRQRQPAQRHQVQRLAGQEQPDDRRTSSAIGIDVQTITTERQLPRKNRIISDTSTAGDHRLAQHAA